MSIIAVWFSIVLVGLWWLIDARLVWFDSNGRLQQQFSQANFEHQLNQRLQTIDADLSSTVIHVTDANCSCNWRTRGHQQAVDRLITQYHGRNVYVDITQHPELKPFIPATPAIIMFDNRAELMYLGPYADGAFCNSETSFVEHLNPAISTNVKSQQGGWVNTVAKGCYCTVAI